MIEEVKAHEGPDVEWMHVEATAEDGSMVSAGGFLRQSRIVRINAAT